MTKILVQIKNANDYHQHIRSPPWPATNYLHHNIQILMARVIRVSQSPPCDNDQYPIILIAIIKSSWRTGEGDWTNVIISGDLADPGFTHMRTYLISNLLPDSEWDAHLQHQKPHHHGLTINVVLVIIIVVGCLQTSQVRVSSTSPQPVWLERCLQTIHVLHKHK